MKVIVCGTRGFATQRNYERFSLEMSRLWPVEELIHGDCGNSPDMFAKYYSLESMVKATPFPADWEAHGKSAGFVRNAIMAEVEGVGHLVSIWDGKSNGTRDMISQAVQRGIYATVIPARMDV